MKKAALICVTRNNAAKLQTTLNSIIRNTKPENYDLFLIDNASSDETLGIYQLKVLADNITIVRSGKNLHWVGGINLGLEMTKSYQYVGFLHDDIEVCPNWLENFFDVLDCNEDVAAVGPITSNDRDTQGYDRLRKECPQFQLKPLEEIDRFNQSAMLQSLALHGTGAKVPLSLAFFCILLRRSVVDVVGGLDSAFTDLYHGDDEDYCRRIRDSGCSLALSFKSYVVHYSGSSSLQIPDENNRRLKAAELIARKYGAKTGINKSPRTYKSGILGIDQIWVINLERRKDRLQRFKQNNALIADKIQVLKACDGRDLELTPQIARLFASNNFQWNKAKMACCLSHLKVWMQLLKEENDDATYLILEDDAVLLEGWHQTLLDAVVGGHIPNDWDVVYLGGTGSKGEDANWHSLVPPFLNCIQGNVFQMNPNSIYGQSPSTKFLHFTAIAYLINKKGVQRTLELIKRANGFWQALDHVVAWRMAEGDSFDRNIYFFWPHIASYFQIESSGFARLYTEEDAGGILDSDIWKSDNSFEIETAKSILDESKPIDFSAPFSLHPLSQKYKNLNFSCKDTYNIIWQTPQGDYTEFEYEYITKVLFSKIHYNEIFDHESYKSIKDKSIIIYSNNNKSINFEFQRYLKQFDDNKFEYCLVHLSNESLQHDCSYYDNAKHVFRNYFDKSIKNANTTFIPLGFKSGFLNKNTKFVIDRNYDFAFIGQPKSDRFELLKIMEELDDVFIYKTNSWSDLISMSPRECSDVYSNTKFVPCPMGFEHPDSFRIMECLESGSIPILKYYGDSSYFHQVWGDSPVPFVHEWTEIIKYNKLSIREFELLLKKIQDWYLGFKESFSCKISDIINS